MILLHDEIEINTTPEKAFDWIAHFQDNYLEWHPDHVKCRVLKGTSILEIGAVFYMEEYLHGELHKLTLRTTKVIPNTRIEYAARFGIEGAFEVKLQKDKVLFIAEISLGTRLPILNWLSDIIMKTLFSDRLEAMRQHMVEEGQNLKGMLEEEFQ